ncbi:integrase domain-containing protein, partial [Acinetobacter baumannii]
YVTNTDKSKTLKDIDLSGVSPYISQSLRLQDAFGLRREESMKFQPIYALDGQSVDTAKHIRLKASWTKGGRARVIPITSDKQRQELKAALVLAKDGSLIPPEKTYKAHLATWEKVTNALEIGQTHGLRHGYAQDRYLQLMGFPCPAVGG